jgi:hypothetical protein
VAVPISSAVPANKALMLVLVIASHPALADQLPRSFMTKQMSQPEYWHNHRRLAPAGSRAGLSKCCRVATVWCRDDVRQEQSGTDGPAILKTETAAGLIPAAVRHFHAMVRASPYLAATSCGGSLRVFHME